MVYSSFSYAKLRKICDKSNYIYKNIHKMIYIDKIFMFISSYY